MISSAVGESSCEAVLENYAAHESTLKEFSPINHLTQDDPPIYLAYDSDLSMPAKSYGHAIHHGSISRDGGEVISTLILFGAMGMTFPR